MGHPSTPEEWQELRITIAEAFDVTELLCERYTYEAIKGEIAGVEVLDYTSAPDTLPGCRTLLFFHGGAYVVGSPELAASIVVPVGHHSGCRTIAVRYGLAPERPYPGSLKDAFNVYRALLKRHDPASIAVFGMSSGASLATAMLLKAHSAGLPMPSALGLCSPWSDLSETGDSYDTLKGMDPVLDYEMTLEYPAELYAGDHDRKDPLISPVYAKFPADFPPTLIQTGTRDLFLSHCARQHVRMREDGVAAALSMREGMWHAFQMTPGMPEAESALRELAGFLVDPGAYFSPDR